MKRVGFFHSISKLCRPWLIFQAVLLFLFIAESALGNTAINRGVRNVFKKASGATAAARGTVRYVVSRQAMGSGSLLGRVPVEAMRSSMEVLQAASTGLTQREIWWKNFLSAQIKMAQVKGALVALGQEKLALCQSMFDRAADTARSETADQFYQLLELHQKAQDKRYFEFSEEETSQLISVIYSFATCGTSVYLDNMTRGAKGVGLEQVSSFIESQKDFIKFATCAKAALSGGLSRSPLVAGVQSSAMIASLIDYSPPENVFGF